jgi:hypothetical protein
MKNCSRGSRSVRILHRITVLIAHLQASRGNNHLLSALIRFFGQHLVMTGTGSEIASRISEPTWLLQT